jgi:hypothetical protein
MHYGKLARKGSSEEFIKGGFNTASDLAGIE